MKDPEQRVISPPCNPKVSYDNRTAGAIALPIETARTATLSSSRGTFLSLLLTSALIYCSLGPPGVHLASAIHLILPVHVGTDEGGNELSDAKFLMW